jgi:DNA-binding response OmpR family regulator
MSSTSIRVLIIEDDAAQLQQLQQHLQQSAWPAFELTTAGTLQEGLARLDERSFDLVLVDLDLPDSPKLDTVVRVESCRSRRTGLPE